MILFVVLIDFDDNMKFSPKPPLKGEVSPQNNEKINKMTLSAATEGFGI